MFDYLIVGAGFAGSMLAERLACDADQRVLICDVRPHIGGNAYDCYVVAQALKTYRKLRERQQTGAMPALLEQAVGAPVPLNATKKRRQAIS
jgi:choline dehydrogenase-like flavoprotein